ncbi:MAG: tRNA 2-thiouridine(34) synthase MnmA [Spirochaetia bacterium]|jgi:tRNA-specific 2-thiouridylase
MKKRVVVGMSGGVDSSVAALLLRAAGHEVIGVTMRIYSGGPAKGPVIDSCYGPGEPADIEEAARVCARLGIPHQVVDLRDEYRSMVIDYARAEYLSGRTPNPCVLCNQRVKFGMLLEKLTSSSGIDFDVFATGHYCRVVRLPETGRYAIRKAAHSAKDQSYFLCMLTQEQLRRVMFPLGEMTKPEVRQRACEAGLANHDRAESQDFAAGGYRAVVDAPEKEGPIKDEEGRLLGTHKGIWKYTVGQRKGLGVGGGDPLYVTRIESATNTVIAGPDSRLYARELVAHGLNWASIEEPRAPLRLDVKIRYRNPAAPAVVTPREGGSADVLFDEPQRAIALGQWAVFYDGDTLVGGGVIG